MSTKKRIDWVDVAKGICMILVIISHAEEHFIPGQMATLKVPIYSFHMPLFFFASGFFSVKILGFERIKERLKYIKNRSFRLMIPYFIMGIIYIPARLLMGGFANESYKMNEVWRILLGENPDGALWFLYALFVISVIAVCVVRKRNLPWILGIAFVLALCSKIITWPTIILEEILFHFFFFIAGIFIRTHYEAWKKFIYTPLTVMLGLIAFIGGNYLLWYASQMTYTGAECLKLITAPSGILLSLNLANMIVKSDQRESVPRKLGNLFGDYSMDIYMFAEPFKVVIKIVFWSLLHLNYLLCTVLCFVGSISLALLVSKLVVRRIPVLKKLFLGM